MAVVVVGVVMVMFFSCRGGKSVVNVVLSYVIPKNIHVAGFLPFVWYASLCLSFDHVVVEFLY